MIRFFTTIGLAITLPGVALAALSNAERMSQFEKAMAAIIAANTPTVSDTARLTLIKDYVACKPSKGQAVELVGANYFRSCEHEDDTPVGDLSLEACQLRYGKPCALIAVNDEIVVEGPLQSTDMPRLHYSGKYDVSKIPIIRRITARRADVQNYDKAMEPKAMAIHPWGKVFISAGDPTSLDAQKSALARCNADPARGGKDGRCFVYAINNDVVINERRIDPK